MPLTKTKAPRDNASRQNRPREIISQAFKATKGEKIDLFVYGILMVDSNLQMLLKRIPKSTQAELHNFMRLEPKWSFPFIVKYHGAVTHGKILKGITKDEIKTLDEFEDEGRLYKRQTVVARTANARQRCMAYVGNINMLEKSFGKHTQFEDRYGFFLEKKIDELFLQMHKDGNCSDRRICHELAGSAADEIIRSQFEGNYICNYIAAQALKEIVPPDLSKIADDKNILPYADNYIRLLCKHVIMNQLVDHVRSDFPDDVRLSEHYFRHGLAVLMAFIYYNRHSKNVESMIVRDNLDKFDPSRSYLDYIGASIKVSDRIYFQENMSKIIAETDEMWFSTPTPLGAELEFSHLGVDAVNSSPGKDPFFDGFFWFKDFDLYRRTWRYGAHVDSHHQILPGQERQRGFFEYAFGRYQIVGDLSRPIFDCPWALSRLINEAVKFLNEIPPHSLHISMELRSENHSNITDKNHQPEDLACLLMLGGDISEDKNGILREKRIFNNELDTNGRQSLNFSDRKHHFRKIDENESEASEVMEFKFIRLRKPSNADFDYENIILALKGYQFYTHGKPIRSTIDRKNSPEQEFLKKWSEKPEHLSDKAIESFVAKVEKGLHEEHSVRKLDPRRVGILESIKEQIEETNRRIKDYEKRQQTNRDI
ncbi:MAG TPA: gamma-glutamylcyclotransferase [Victivallales bacterium]|nr:gamma-glutamylcyclotransferase [Victivallales bacterium]